MILIIISIEDINTTAGGVGGMAATGSGSGTYTATGSGSGGTGGVPAQSHKKRPPTIKQMLSDLLTRSILIIFSIFFKSMLPLIQGQLIEFVGCLILLIATSLISII